MSLETYLNPTCGAVIPEVASQIVFAGQRASTLVCMVLIPTHPPTKYIKSNTKWTPYYICINIYIYIFAGISSIGIVTLMISHWKKRILMCHPLRTEFTPGTEEWLNLVGRSLSSRCGEVNKKWDFGTSLPVMESLVNFKIMNFISMLVFFV